MTGAIETGIAETGTVETGIVETGAALVGFFRAHGCLPLGAADPALPAAAFHPETFFRLLSPGPWRAVCLQPVLRPMDARSGRHPVRSARHLQVEAVFRGPPDDAVALLLASLVAGGLEPERHDLRFTAGNWASRALAAWGIGWRLAVDGVPVARLTALQELAERPLGPTATLLTVGVERLAMRVAGVRSLAAVPVCAGGPPWGAVAGPEEAELARFAGEVAAPEPLRARLVALEEESARCAAAGLVRHAYALAVEGLGSIDLLSARGELDPRDRERHLRRVRALVLAAAERFLAADPVAPLATLASLPAPPAPTPPPVAPAVPEKPKPKRAARKPGKRKRP